MGILNLTSDSFYSGSRVNTDQILGRARVMIEESAEILDLGAYSSRPGAKDIPLFEERDKITEAVSIIRSQYPSIILSVDSFRSEVATAGIEAGADIINDISAGDLDPKMFDLVCSYGNVPYIMMHMRGNPQAMKSLTDYNDVTSQVFHELLRKVRKLKEAGVHDLIIDPGFGFAKTIDQNFEMLGKLDVFSSIPVPLLAGVSRKSMIYKTLNIKAEEALNGTTTLNTLALLKGAKIVRVHDVKEAKEAIDLLAIVM